MAPEVVSRLVGVLGFQVNPEGLYKFRQAMKTAEIQMRALSKEADTLALKLGKKLGIKVDPAVQNKLSAAVAKNLDREAKAEIVVQKLRRQTFQAELAGQRLLFAGKKEAQFLTTADVRHQQSLAVLASKQQKSELDRIKTEGQVLRNQDSLAQAKARQTKAELIHQQIAQRTANLKAQELKAMNGTQRLQQAMNDAAERGRRAALKFTQQQAKSRVTDQRQTERFQMAQERHAAFQARLQVWEANRNKPQPTSLLGLSGTPLVLTGVTAGLAGIVAAVEALGTRIQARQDGASEAQNFNNALNTAGGKSVDNQRIARDAYFEVSDKYGTEVSLEGAKDYAKFVQGQLALGKSLTQAIQVFSDQSATFRAAALNGEAQKRAAYQLSQIRAKGKPEGSDVNDLFDATGGVVASSIRDAAATRLGFKGKPEEEAGWFKAQVTAGKILAKDFDQGMTNFLKANQDILAKQMKSIDASQTRADNQKYLNEVGLNSDIELTQAVQENIEAHRQLNKAMQPLFETFKDLDIGLTKLSTFFLRLTAGKNADGSEKTEQQKVQERMTTQDLPVDTAMVGGHDYTSVDTNQQRQGGPIGKFWNWVLGIPDPNNASAIETDNSQNAVTDQWMPIIRSLPQPLTANDIQKMNQAQKSNQTLPGKDGDKATSAPAEPQTINNDNSQHTVVESPNISIAITAPAGLDERKVALLARKELELVFSKYMPAEAQ